MKYLLTKKSLTLKDLFISESCIEKKIELNFYFHYIHFYFYSLKAFIKPFEAPQRSVKKNLIFISKQPSEMNVTGRVKYHLIQSQ